MQIKPIKSGKNNKLLYTVKSFLSYLIPNRYFRARLNSKITQIRSIDDSDFMKRVNYYCKLDGFSCLDKDALVIGCHKYNKNLRTTYFFDSYECVRWFDLKLRWKYCFGDITFIPAQPSIVKSRPINGDNRNSVLLKLNKIRHYIFVNDEIPFRDKKNKAIFRGKVLAKQQRVNFFNKFFNHPMCNLGDTQPYAGNPKEWVTNFLSIYDHLNYKFILALEGNDVASNLRWIMGSNSIAVMCQPNYETWFMEGTLIPDYHYISIKDDFSDFEEKINYYIKYPEKAEEIIRHANAYVEQFKDEKREFLLSLAVLDKYFTHTNKGYVK